MRRGVLVAVTLSLSVLMGSTTAGAATPKHTLTGSLEIVDDSEPFYTNPCDGSATAGFGDLSAGASVTVRNASGRIIALGSLQGGKRNYDGATCTMPFRVKGVPQTSFYQVTVADRKGVSYSLGQLKRSHWKVALSLGG